MRETAGRLWDAARELGYRGEMVLMPVTEVHGAEPPPDVARQMLRAEVILAITSRSVSHTRARAAATQKGVRIATMAGVTGEMLERFAGVDLEAMGRRTNRVADILDKGEQVRLGSEAGTGLSFSIRGRLAHGRKASVFDRPGYWGNIPCGEAFIAPVEQSVQGRLVVDASVAGIGLLREAMVFEIDGGRAVSIEGGEAARRFAAVLNEPRKRQVAEFGVGTNDRARITGVVLEDEKVLGTCHVAFGNNVFFGGANRVGLHLDCVVREPTIEVDGEVVMSRGVLR
jgi:leucyl aminopeptidase (aminopeptidase T)